MTKPIVRWPGGKARLLPRCRPLVPQNVRRIVSPFGGGLALELDLLARRPELGALLADLNPELIATYTCVRDDVETVLVELRKHDWTEAGYLRVRDRDPADAAGLEPAERAARFLFLNRCAFNGLQRENACGQNNVAFGGFDPRKLPAWERRIRACSAVLSRAELMAGDFETTLAWVEPGDLVFCDPPYDGTFTGYTAGGFDDADQERLARALHELSARGVRVLTTNSDTERIRALYGPSWHVHEIPVRRGIAGDAASRRAVTELAFTNYEPAESSPKDPPVNMTGAQESAPETVQTEIRTLQRSRRLDDAEVLERVQFVQELLRSGMDRGAIVRAFRERFGGSTRTADGYLAKAREAFAIQAVTPQALGEKRESERRAFQDRLDADIEECKRAGVWNAVVGLRRLQADVMGLRVLRQAEAPAPQAPAVQVAIHQTVMPEQVREHRLELLSRLIERNPDLRDRVLGRLGQDRAVVVAAHNADEPGTSNGHSPDSQAGSGNVHSPDSCNGHVSRLE